jgi:predicted TIM-barrel fold metal-dependent hydrolase
VTDPGADGWDCHVHVFDASHPVQPGHYQALDRPLVQIEAAARALGCGHLVLVQPSVYGTDNSAMLEALAQDPVRLRAVAVVPFDVDAQRVRELNEQVEKQKRHEAEYARWQKVKARDEGRLKELAQELDVLKKTKTGLQRRLQQESVQ